MCHSTKLRIHCITSTSLEIQQIEKRPAPVLENAPVFGLKFVQHPRLVIGPPRPEHDMMRPLDDRNRINLHVTEPFYSLRDALFALGQSCPTVEEMSSEGDSTGHRPGNANLCH